MKKQIMVLLAGCTLLESTGRGQQTWEQWEQPKAKLTIQVKDENNTPVDGASVRMEFFEKNTHKQAMLYGKTDAKGELIGEGYSGPDLGADVRKDGYYTSGSGFIFKDATNGNWIPWNPIVTTILRPVGKPVALYAKHVETRIPTPNKPCGYDLEVGDWTMPYGKGRKKDFIFTVHQDYHGIQNYDLRGELTFAESLDGLQETSIPAVGKNSIFKWERQAPENGYQSKFAIQNTWSPEGKLTRSFKSPDDWQGSFFRVRTVEQDGKIVSAHYGKIRGGIYIYPDRKGDKPKIDFTYYYNPTPNDRNLEWDTKNNLFGGLNREQTPREP